MSGTIVDFSSRRVVGAKPKAFRTVADIAEALTKGRRTRGKCDAAEPLRIRLDDLCGVSDDTVETLGVLAADGTLTPESAARLAVRHSKEIGLWTGARKTASSHPVDRFDLAISGDVFGSFAIRIGAGGVDPWVGTAAATAYGSLLDVCPRGGRGICLLVGPVDPAGTTIRIVTTPEWQVTLVGRSCRPGWRSVEHLLVVGNLPKDDVLETTICRYLEQKLGRRADLELLMPPGWKADPSPLPAERGATTVFTLLELALPGLLRAERENPRR